MEICEKMKKARSNAGMTQEQVAEKIEVSRQTISNWENGKTLPDVMSVIKLSDLYQVTLDELLKGDSKMMDKIKKDTDTVKSNQSLIKVAWILIIVSFLFSVWCNSSYAYDGNNPILQFSLAAIPWVLMGVGIVCIAASVSHRKKN
ncbi:MAG: helix-turn-helix transcriptional regulator [Oscillospiraceae bacterium]|nr:helix-turn-helix transcriptional regulator [Oscillospiraceae bacterium]